MHVVVLGAGITGITTAYCLNRAGHRVTVVDQDELPAMGTTHANAAQLSFAFVDSLATPDILPALPGMLLGRDMGARVSLDPAVVGWGLRFVAASLPGTSRRSTQALADLARHSADAIGRLLDEVPIDFDYRRAGKTVLLADANAVRRARDAVELKRRLGSDVELLDRDEAVAVEPTLDVMHEPYAGALYSASDAVGDACAFTRGLAAHLGEHGDVAFRFGSRVESVEVAGGRVAGVVLAGDYLAADAVVVALGTGSRALFAKLGITMPILPVRGYSVTLPPGPQAPDTSVTSIRNHFVFTRLGDRVRVAGFTDFVNQDTRRDEERLGDLLATAKASAPLAADYEVAEQHRWGGFRPMTPDGVPRVGRTGVDGLFANTGHGMLGWTLAAGTAERVTAEISEVRTA